MDPAERRRLILVMGMIVAIGPMSIDMYLPSLPSLQTHFGVEEGAVQLTLSAYFVGLAIGQLVYGPVSDRIGRRGPMLFGLSLYVLSSLVCAFAPSIEVLIGARFVQAIGGCAGMIITRAIVRDRFDTQEMASVLSSMVLVMGVAPILAPIVGGYVLHFAGWQTIFVALALFGVACITAAHRSLPESLRERGQPLRFGLVLANYGRLLRHRRFMGYALSGGVATAGMFAYISGAAFVFIEVFGIATDRFGYYFGANAAGFIVVSQLNPLLLRRFRAEFILRVALTTHALAALVLLLMAATGWGGLWGVMVPL
ncbi:MAG: multidrug effflux MFS transporter, partial [Gammaproteobacteria bacterium]